LDTAPPKESGSSATIQGDGPGTTVHPRRWRLTILAVAAYSVYVFVVFLMGVALWAWLRYRADNFTPDDTAFLAAESTLLLAAAAVLVIVFEIERARSASTKRGKRRDPRPKG
jgi:ABC-type Fe3+ transport system permease subunit